MRLNHITLSILTIALAISSCTKGVDDGVVMDDKVEVVLSADQAATRTSIEDDLTTTRWEIGDEIALWATGADDGVARMSGELFTMRYYGLSYSQAEFSSKIAPMDESQEYQYKAFYPYPSTISGTDITYKIASTQSGKFDGLYDFRVADEVTGKALTESTIGGCNLSFRSLTHAIRITIPAGYNKLDDAAGEPVGIAKLIVTLPFDAVGTLAMNMKYTSISPSITSNAGRTVTIDTSDDPLYAGDGRYVWLFINPASDVTGDITISANGARSASGVDGAVTDIYTIPIANRDFSAGCITPINTQIEEEIPYTINFKLGTTNLGEAVTKMTITTADGSVIKDGKSSLTMSSNTGDFSFEYTPRTNPTLATKSLKVSYESNSAIVTGKNLTIGTLAAGLAMDVTYNVPYLYEEDFSGISETGNYDGLTGSDLPGLSDIWTDGIVFAYQKGASIAVRAYGFAVATNGYLNMKLSTATGLKSGKTVKLHFSFYADWNKNKLSKMGLKVSNDDHTATISNMKDISNSSFTYIPTPRNVELADCSSSSIIKWKTDGSPWRAYYDYVYIDNIKVKIVQ